MRRRSYNPNLVKIGFSGTQAGMTEEQKSGLSFLLGAMHFDEFHHGMCKGADEEAHDIVRLIRPSVKIIGHPPTNKLKMAKLIVDTRRKPYQYLLRNSNIVHATRQLIVCPRTNEITLRSGTCATFRYAKKAGKPISIIWPTGDIDEE
jgi:hypothetical protein